MEELYEIIEVNDIKIKHLKGSTADISEVFDEDIYRIKYVKEGGLVINIGANIGLFSLRCAVERGCTVYAYEPRLFSFKIFSENIKLNNMQNKIKAFRIAVGAKNEVRKLYYRSKQRGGGIFFPSKHTVEEELVDCITLKHVFEDNNIKHCDTLKMDCEGAEREIFSEESRPFIKCADYVVLEWHYYDGRIYSKYLEELGFSTLLTGGGYPPPPYHITIGAGILHGWNRTKLDLRVER